MKDKIIELTTEQLENYIKCPNRFFLQHVSGIKPKTHISVKSILLTARDKLLYRILDGKYPDCGKFINEFVKECQEHNFLSTNRAVMHGMRKLTVLHQWCVRNQLLLADMGTEFELPFPKDNAILKGNFGIIRYYNKKLELLGIDFTDRDPDQNLLDISLRYTLQSYAIRRLVPKYELSCVRVLAVRQDRLKEFQTFRSPLDYERLEDTVSNVIKAVRNEVYYPRETFECTQCPVKIYCGGLSNHTLPANEETI